MSEWDRAIAFGYNGKATSLGPWETSIDDPHTRVGSASAPTWRLVGVAVLYYEDGGVIDPSLHR